jgi:zinc transporter ZupT
MEFLRVTAVVGLRTIIIAAFIVVSFVPASWAAGWILEPAVPTRLRDLCAVGLALVGYLSVVNLIGRATNNSYIGVACWLAPNGLATAFLWRRWRAAAREKPLLASRRPWLAPLVAALVIGLPQWLIAVSTNYYDEVASSAIHITAPNQFAEGMFPPRHNALPDIAIKYHYGFTILSGTVRLLTGLSANVSIDVVSTALWLFTFLFVCSWLRTLDFDRVAALWGGFATLLGGGLAWLYLPRIESYGGIEKVPPLSQITHHFDPARSWVANLLSAANVPSQHLRNVDGSLSNLPWDIAAQFQQHAVSLGIAMTVISLFLFTTWQKREGLEPALLAANAIAAGVLFLAHSVFGAVTALTLGICLLASWVRRPTRWRFYRGLGFAAGVAALALLHGGMLARGAQYGGNAATTFRTQLGYAAGGLAGMLSWNIAGFGLPLLLTLLAWGFYLWRRDSHSTERRTLFIVLTVFGVVSYSVPQLMYYSSETNRVEQYTEISKFFFCAHFAFALLSAFAISRLRQWVHWGVLLPGFAVMAVSPLAYVYAGSFRPDHTWAGFYRAPYKRGSIEEQMGDTLQALKRSNHDVYFDASADERRHDFLSELLIYSGSVFTLTPSRYERTGIGYRLSEAVVARRYLQNGRMMRLLPGAAEDCRCDWYYSRPTQDVGMSPLIVRNRFEKLVAEGYFVPRFEAGLRTLYAIEKPTADLDYGLDRFWRPRIVLQTHGRRAGAGKREMIFFDLVSRRILAGDQVIESPGWMLGELSQIYTANFRGGTKPDFLFARMKDTEFRLGKSIDDVVEQSMWGWTYRDSRDGQWQPEYARWWWDWDTPLIADVVGDGFDSQVAYRRRTGQWLLAPDQPLNGPKVDEHALPVPFAGRFLAGSRADLGLWSLGTGMVTLQSLVTGLRVDFKWGGRPGDVLVPGDYDGIGHDEIAVWQRSNHTWYWRQAPDGPITQAVFGTDTSVPIPADYNGDGKLDLAYWEPSAGKIFVSYSRGRTIDLTISVPPHSIPAFVNMY